MRQDVPLTGATAPAAEQRPGTDRGVLMLEILSAWACGEDVPLDDEDMDWLDDQVALGMLESEFLPPDVFQRVMQIHESVELTEQLMRRL